MGGPAWWEILVQPRARREAQWGSNGWRGMEKWRKQTAAEVESHLLHRFLPRISALSVVVNSNVYREARIQFLKE